MISKGLYESCNVEELVSCWLEWAKDWYPDKPASTHNWLRPVFSTLLSEWRRTSANDFRPRDLKRLREMLVARGNSRKYVNRQVSRLISVWRWGVEEELVDAPVVQALSAVRPLQAGRTVAYEVAPVTPVDPDLVEDTIRELHWPVNDMVRLQSLLGCRPGEVCKLKTKYIRPYHDLHVIELPDHKTAWRGKEKFILIGPRAWLIIEQHRRIRLDEQYLFSPRLAAYRARNGFKHAGDCYRVDSYLQAVHRACDRAGVDRWNVGQLRHSSATTIRQEFGIEAAQAVLGHASVTTTERYAERVDDRAVEAVRRLG